MSTYLNSIFKSAAALIRSRIGRWLGTRTLPAWAAAIFARLKDLAPYAVIELLLPGGSVLALSLWLYRRRRKALVLGRSLNGVA